MTACFWPTLLNWHIYLVCLILTQWVIFTFSPFVWDVRGCNKILLCDVQGVKMSWYEMAVVDNMETIWSRHGPQQACKWENCFRSFNSKLKKSEHLGARRILYNTTVSLVRSRDWKLRYHGLFCLWVSMIILHNSTPWIFFSVSKTEIQYIHYKEIQNQWMGWPLKLTSYYGSRGLSMH